MALSDTAQHEDPMHGHEEGSQDDGVGHEGELSELQMPTGSITGARAKRIQQAMQEPVLHVVGGIKPLGEIPLEQEAKTINMLQV
ncbi:hypothetical protein CRG98_038149 [Punica granatum]|uniref:Uncharacterized protein n=1 Tax=Punica granatum TaxID=22663 RepID=A0A2I0ICM9_PUNGR|nr:hypothetical protein CRG98_038149 [Punica granatum]